jgi:hypothetical protein
VGIGLGVRLLPFGRVLGVSLIRRSLRVRYHGVLVSTEIENTEEHAIGIS